VWNNHQTCHLQKRETAGFKPRWFFHLEQQQKGTDMERQRNNAIRRARRLWEKNKQIPMDLFAELVELGIDVQALEDKYLKFE
jgi:Zn-dependent M32 family carboxypeptidase